MGERSERDEHAIPRTYGALVAIGQALFAALRLRPDPHGVEHVPRRSGAVLVITHFGYLDFALVEWVLWRRSRRWIRFLATKASFSHPVSGPLMRAMRHITVDRTKGTDAYRDAVQALQDGHLVGVFPEGRVTGDWEVLPCAGGAARMASAAAVPLIPIAVWGGHRVMTLAARAADGRDVRRAGPVPGPAVAGVGPLVAARPPRREPARRRHPRCVRPVRPSPRRRP